ncbi:hypothetical protein [Nocardia testacea]|uniref:Uncharacterized protein n=1 Tax=Nocardia testacea TaxID=248551 RepID=A0ABW7W7I6_9NOCA
MSTLCRGTAALAAVAALCAIDDRPPVLGTATADHTIRTVAQPDPCGANQYGCHAPYGACDNYQPGCAGPYDSGIEPYDYDQNRPYYTSGLHVEGRGVF